jgi:hypothetical protein
VSVISKTTNDILKFIPIDGTTFIYNTQNYVSIGHSRRCAADKLLNTNEKIKYITTILDYNPLSILLDDKPILRVLRTQSPLCG